MTRDKIAGTLYGMAYGDAMGMPPELWSRKRLQAHYGRIEDFLDGCSENIISYMYKKGQFTDDTSQALAIVASLMETGFKPNPANIARHILDWAEKENAFALNILGPTSKVALKAFQEGRSAKEFTDEAASNGAAMRIAPIGTLFHPDQLDLLCQYVADISLVTHTSDVTVAGACMIAGAVSEAMESADREKMIETAVSAGKKGMLLGSSTPCPSLEARTRLGILLANQYKEDEEQFLQTLYDVVGAGVNTSESVPAALALAYYAWDVKKCALLAANLGGDTDTIGAMACAICGAAKGASSIPSQDLELLETANETDFSIYIDALEKERIRA
jgi:ADP-ribosylglycohydrolase